MIRFAYTILYVKEVERAIRFYEEAFGFTRKFIAEGNSYGELVTGNTVLSFASVELAASNLPEGFMQSHLSEKPFGIEIGFTTDNVEKVFAAAIQAGATEVARATIKPWGQVVAYVRDPEGFLVEICTSME